MIEPRIELRLIAGASDHEMTLRTRLRIDTVMPLMEGWGHGQNHIGTRSLNN